MSADLLTTDRLLLRRWLPSDREPFAELNADPRVMEHFPHLLTREQSDAMIDRLEGIFEAEGFGIWAVEVRATGEFIGFIGLAPVGFDEHFTPALEIGWRLAHGGWGHGYATEGARAALDHAFRVVGREEVVSMTATTNLRSQAVMRRLGMTCDRADDFDHPRVDDDRLRRHVLFRITAAQWGERV
ncbi:RimJ/RimL family protein N-acetyltransferase [Allocatelliglobosispora scoriae]|uniref:RimJ/RimL family protein N-acetyltransferase n=1 Tax=Allocatelliglobosispora scoriae TaxID=643052 RepID=A0A841C3Q4_9ACTN|nr:GNAT family N-acetyltransferase [Allocatelliglobosispora scoriae]MBB5873461.1 RimJ/RimL family protein N-acetyltransferase [Allocatelliglobosispora scoriae]